MISGHDISHLEWLINRIVHKFGDKENDQHIVYARQIVEKLSTSGIDIIDKDLDIILNKYYADFLMDKCELWGFTDEERNKLRKQTKDICTDIIHTITRKKE